MRILITGGRAPATLDLVRTLAQDAEAIFIAESAPMTVASFSRYIERSFRVPPPRQDPKGFHHALREIIIKQGITHMIPTCEELFTVLEDEHWLRERICLFAPPHDALLRLHSKWRFAEWMSSIGLEVPNTEQIVSRDKLAEHVTSHGKTHVYKPEWSRFGVKVRVGPESADWVAGERCDERYAWLAQERIIGEQWCTYSWLIEGQLTAHACYPMAFSKGTQASLVFSHQDHPLIEAWVKRFGELTQLTGQIAFDFIVREDKVFAIECNPRLTSGMHTLYRAELTQRLPLSPQRSSALPASFTAPIYGKTESQALKAALLIYAPIEAKTSGLGAWWRAMFLSQDVLLRWSDPLPGLLWPLGYLYFVWIAWREGLSAVAASTFDIEWNSER